MDASIQKYLTNQNDIYHMKRILTICATVLCLCLTHEAQAQTETKTEVQVSRPFPVSTQVTDGRYEFIQSTINSSQAFLLDKYSGDVWKYLPKRKEFEKIVREHPDTPVPDRVNYQIYLSSKSSSICFLLNAHTGETWRYVKDLGSWRFRKITMPWENK